MATRVTLAYPYTDRAGKKHKAGDTVTLDAGEARGVIHGGIGRPADKSDEKAAK